MSNLRRFFIVCVLFAFASSYAQDSTTTTFQQDAAIQLSAFVEQNEIPQNRTVVFKMVIEWYGDLDRFEVIPFDNPIVQNFEIVGSGSANRVGVKNGQRSAIREYTFTLKPQALGMGYVEGMIVKYTDLATDTDYTLTSNRVPVEIIAPLPEPGDKTWLLYVLAGIIAIAAAAVALRYGMQQKKLKQQQAAEAAVESIPIEENYLKELKGVANFSQPNIDTTKVVSDIAKLLRKFFTERYQTPDFKVTTNEFINFLYANKYDDLVVKDVKEILSTADVVKFSGLRVERDFAERAFTLSENILQKSLHGEIQQ